jgi:hypothetical protein
VTQTSVDAIAEDLLFGAQPERVWLYAHTRRVWVLCRSPISSIEKSVHPRIKAYWVLLGYVYQRVVIFTSQNTLV